MGLYRPRLVENRCSSKLSDVNVIQTNEHLYVTYIADAVFFLLKVQVRTFAIVLIS